MNKIMMKLFTVIMLMMFSMGVEAQIKVDLGGEKNDGVYPGGTIAEKGQTEPDANGLVTVKITVTPKNGYVISQNDIMVVSTYNPSNGTRSDSPNIAAKLNPVERDPEDLSQPREYSYIVSSTFGVWVKEANFKKEEDTSKGGENRGSINSLSSIVDDPTGDYTITADIDASGFTTIESFSGTLEAAIDPNTNMPYRIKNLSVPLFTTLTGTVKNLVFENVAISGHSGNTGAIACDASGDNARIYNVGILSGSVGGTGNTGGLVGQISGKARVINCYSFATITGGTNVGGIVGNNNATTTATSINTMVMNCMFYGDITGGTTKSPVYGGTNIDNLQGGLNTFNYYAYEQLPTSHITSKKYNCALAVEEKYLNRFEFYRLLLNSNKKLAAFYVTGSAGDGGQMLKWVLETADRTIDNPKPYPVLKAQGYYPSIINPDFANAPDSATIGRNHGGKLGTKTLSVTILKKSQKTDGGQSWPTAATSDVQTTSLRLTRTDKDFDRFNFNYDKVQLPYYNDVGTGNYTENRVVTGWKITAITAIEGDPYTALNYPTTGIKDYPDHNYADRKSSNKDLYSVSGRVFSQGAYFDVPYGVTEITIEPYWGNAIYVADQYYDVVYKADYSGKQGVSQVGTQVSNSIKFNDQSVKNSITGLGSGTTVYDNAVVLVGNFHLDAVPSGSGGTTPFTMMSVDENNDHEPDCSLIYHHKGRTAICPIRFDFLNIPGTAQAQKPNGASLICNFTIFKTKGWFEVTNTSSFYSSQLEYENLDGVTKSDAPLILQGGVIDQFVSTQSKAVSGKTIYIHVGGNVWIKEFGMGTHSDGSQSTPHVPVSVTGGEFPGFYLTGTYKADANVRTDNAECYISGGYFHEAAGASLEQINGNVRWQIYNADIDNFYGGGINDAKPIKGDITVDIYNSHVTTYCGGPKFGNMQAGKKVTTNAEGCVFGTYFGAGFGGTSIAQKKYYDKDGTQNWATLQGYYTTDRGNYFNGTSTQSSQISGKDYGKKGPGVATDFDYEFFVWSSGTTGARLYVKFASFSLAQCNDVESKLKSCTVENNFYGGGSLGKVTGTATSVLDGCTVNGNVFGGGYSANLPKIKVRDGGFKTNPNFNSASGMFEPGVFSGTTDFTWKSASEAGVTLTNGQSGSDLETNHYVYTNADLTTLGQVQNVDLTVKGSTYVQGMIYKYGDDGTTIVSSEQTGGVFGGGDESAVKGNTKVDIQGTATSGTNQGINNVYGGGNTADVEGGTTVSVTGGKTIDVYGGGRGETTTVKGDVTVHIGKSFKNNGSVENTGSPSIEGSVYGGSAFGSVNETTGKETKVNIYGGTIDGNVYGGTINGSVYGGGKGEKTSTSDIAAKTFGNVTVTMEGGTVKTAVYGGSNVNGVLTKDATVTIIGGTVGTAWTTSAPDPLPNVVFGGGKGEPTQVNGNVTVNIGTEGQSIASGAAIYGNVYGGSALGNTSASKTGSDPMVFNADKTTNVNLYAGTINGNAFGGGLGQRASSELALPDVESFVGGDVNVLLDGAKVHQIFGCNNLNGTPKGHVKVHVKRTNNFSGNNDYKNNSDTSLDARTTYDVTAVYGGGNQADYEPTDATITLPAPTAADYKEKLGKLKNARTEVLIEGCDKTSIEYVYGGGNAAAVPADSITVNSAYIIGQLFGGGNGAGDDNPGADVGIIDKTAYEANHAEGLYGTGIASTTLIGGQVRYVYGGSNTKGNVCGGTSLKRKESNTYCDLKIKEIYGAGQLAPMDGDVNLILECMPKDFVDQVFGGAKNATINGNVSLTVTSGKFGRVFGGNNEGGSINGAITVNVYEDGCQPLIIGELYGGGFNAPYSIWGCNDSDRDDNWTPNTPEGNPHVAADANAVSVYVYSCTSIGKVFGGGYGETADVVGNTHVYINMMKGLVDDPSKPGYKKENALGKIGQVFGGGNKGVVKGNTLIDIGTALAYDGEENKIDNGVRIESGTDYLHPESKENIEITAGVYGGGNEADVVGNTTLNIGKEDLPLGVNITGDIFGGGLGENTTVTGNVVVNIGKKVESNVNGATTYTYEGYANITGDVYGGSAKGKVNATKGANYASNDTDISATTGQETKVNLFGGTITGNLYGGGLGESTHAADVYGPVTVNVEGGSVFNVFGCNNTNGTPKSTIAVNIDGGVISQSVYGGGNLAITDGSPVVTVTNGTIGTENEGGAVYGNVYGGGLGSNADVRIGLVKGNTEITVKGGNVLHNIYGGGAYGSVGTYTYASDAANAAITALATENTGKATIKIEGGTIGTDGLNNGMVFGSSRGDIDAIGAIQDNMAWVYETDVQIGTENDGTSGPTIHGSLYGGGENGHVFHDTSVTMYSGTVGNMEEYYSNRGNVYGGGCGTDKYYTNPTEVENPHDGDGDKYNPTAGIVGHDAKVIIKGGKIANNVYGAGSMGKVEGNTYVTIDTNGTIGIDGNHDDGNVYGAARGELNLVEGNLIVGNPDNFSSVTNSSVTIKKGTVKGNVFGGGKAGIVKGNVDVTVSGGVVKNDVYGGGALANTNTDNWDTLGSATRYVEVTNLEEKEYYNTISITVGQSVEGYYTYNGSTYVAATGTAVKGETYYQKLTGAPIAGYYTQSGDDYILQTSGTADPDETYFKKVVTGSWASQKNVNNETVNKTTVILTGGSVGNVYGGGLGSSTVAANVYGDVKVTVNKPEELSSTGGTGVAFSYKSERVTFGEGDKRKEYVIPLTGRVFGCNNINGTPTGNVRVEVYSTRQADEDGILISNTEHSPNSNNNRYEIQGVYGGGNLSDYLPAEGKSTSVYIGECDVTSIEKVYGGGNSASVPTSNVTIHGSYDIGYAFGGGNGGDLIKKDGVWYENAGAIVISQAYIAPIGGKIGAVFGGSDAKGNCGSIVIDKTQTNPSCPLRLLRLYGAGNEADVDEVNIIISGCSGGDNAEIEYVYGGSYNANVAHDVKLTITAGKFKNVYGGNDRTGSIGGNITVNIEETDNCMPITIQNLLGGGYQAPYPGTKRDGTEITTPGKIWVNVKSATRIDNIYGGSFKADVNGDTEVNINMTKGWWAGQTYDSETIANSVGTIGNIYGGGNQGLVRGNSTVNIATATSVGYVTEPVHLREDPNVAITQAADNLYYVPVTGARITGDVFGGGNEANVKGNATVNICIVDYSGVTGFEGVSISNGSVYGGGNQSDVLGNTNVTMSGGYVFNGIFGGGYSGSVGTFTTSTEAADVNVYGHTAHAGCIGKPVSCAENTGKCTIVVNGDAQIGPVEVATQGMPVPQGWVWGGGCGLIEDPATNPDTHFKTYVGSTDVTIGGNAFIMEGVIGGAEFGRVLNNTLVKIQDHCQIGVGAGKAADGKPVRYTDGNGSTTNQFIDPIETAVTESNALAACSHYDFESPFAIYDPYADDYPTLYPGGSTNAVSNGGTWIGVVFGGGSGYMPYKKTGGYDWCRSAGWVEGDTEVRITGGHILTNVYGGNEYTDVKGTATVTMSGGTIGVPRTKAQIEANPLTGYLFGAGKGDPRSHFNSYTNVGSTVVNVSGGIIYGSVLGGSEDGHVLGNTSVTISGGTIGTWGTTYYDGNVFGGGRGFSGENLIAGSVGGNVSLSISGGKILGSVYGGGRLASVGIDSSTPAINNAYGQLVDDDGDNTYGHVTMNITGGTIGTTTVDEHSYNGNVYGGSMGRIEKLDGTTINDLWPKLAVVKTTSVSISGTADIKNNVYGGGEIGIVRNQATVNIGGGIVNGSVFCGGYGSDNHSTKTVITPAGYVDSYYTFIPILWAGCVSGNTNVTVSSGEVKKNVYGGGELASVGLINFISDASGNFTGMTKHESLTDGFGLSWPYKFQYISADPKDTTKDGTATVSITGGTIGTQEADVYLENTGYVYGGCKGQVAFGTTDDIDEQRYTEAFCANVRETEVTIGGGTMRTVYGGGEDGHVNEDANIIINNGTINSSVFGGGKGTSTYTTTLWDIANEGQPKGTTDNVNSWTAGKVYGNTNITMNGGNVGCFIYGGGNVASVGKGNYAGGADDYSTGGYGETLTGNLWDNESDDSKAFLSSGKTTITILGGNVGSANAGFEDTYGIPYGSVFGGSRGKAAKTITLSPRYKYGPDFFLGYVNKAIINIGGTSKSELSANTPNIYGSIYGGGQDGHVRNNTEVKIFKGNVAGQESDIQGRTGHVFGAGSGIGRYTDNGSYCNNASGSVTCTTLVEVYDDAVIAGNVYGGGALASVGPPQIGQPKNEQKAASDDHASYSHSLVNIKGGTINGSVYGASRGPGDVMFTGDNRPFTGIGTDAEKYNPATYATSLWTEVNIEGGTIGKNVYGGGEMGRVKENTVVNLKGGKVTHNAYGGGKGTRGTNAIEANVGGNTTVVLNNNNNGSDADGSKKGCVVDKVFGCNDLNGTPKGHVTVHVYATQKAGQAAILPKAALPPAYSAEKASDEGYIAYMERLITQTTAEGGLLSTDPVITAAQATISGKTEASLSDSEKTAILNAAKAIDVEMNNLYDRYGYDVTAVYGGGDLALYEPDVNEDNTEVIIEGCGTTSIKQVYGGGNAAPVSATDVTVKSCYIIGELFGGGNGHDNYQLDGKWYENPGAHVGYTQFAYYVTDGTKGTGADEANKYTALVPSEADGNTEEAKAYRQTHYRYGTGVASSTINGGHVHKAYGGSNEKGNIGGEIASQIQQVGTCTIVTGGTYGGSKSADTDATINVTLDCVENGGEFYGGSYKANINSDVHMHITNGTYSKIFGGNDRAGTINGKITITIEEYGCTPINITELYAGGNLAPYSVYGYKTETQKAKDVNGNDISDLDQRIPYRAGEIGARTTPYWDPRINIISATSIGAIYGGGYGAGATMIGNPHINVNMTNGKIRASHKDHKSEYATLYPDFDSEGNRIIPIGTIGTIYGGGNLASVEGDTYVEIGTGQWIESWDANGNPVWESTNASGDKYSYKEKIPAVYYTQAECNTYNAANVSGYIASGTVLTTDQVTAVNTALGTSYVAGAELTTKDANAYNATLPGARKTTDPKNYYTQADCDEYNATLNGALNSSNALTADQATAYNTAMSGSKAEGDFLSESEANAYNAKLTGAKKEGDVKSYYTQAECDEHNKTIDGYIAKHTKLDADQATRVNTALTPSYVEGNPISEEDANAYNATLDGARKTTDVKKEAEWAWYDESGTEVTTPLDLAPRNEATITGNVFGGGKGEAKLSGDGAFQCAKGMIGVDGDGIDYPEGGTNVTIANGSVGTIEKGKLKAGTGNVYGGGEIGRVEKNTVVTIGLEDDDTNTPTILGNVFGAGKGVETHGYSALVRGNTSVTIQGKAKVGGSVYGGGEIASVGRYNVVGGRPTSLKNPNSGNCIVTVRDDAEIGPNDMIMTKVGGPDNSGHVFGAGKGAMPGNYQSAKQMTLGNTLTGFTSEEDYLKFIETLALATHTDVTIGGNAFVKGDVFGGAEQGFVQHDTHVTIEGDCQIGNGYVQMDDDGTYLAADKQYSLNRRYTDEEWAAGHLIKEDESNYSSSLPECASWPYLSPYASHDIYADSYDSQGGAVSATSGHTFYGNVFGGGSGYFPYKPGKWHWKAGEVGGNTLVEINGGHILTNVYGGNEMTNVDGKSTITMTGGTIGVPRTLGQIMKHPVTCYLFGGGGGDPRVLFNKQTNVQDVEMNITGGWVYGSVFGGGEDGHVMRNVDITIGGTAKIGTWGTSYVDGNVFGGGRGFSGDAYTAGNVAGSVTMNINGGEILGSVYGGGRLGSVGYGLYDEGVDGYGEIRDDHKFDNGTDDDGFFAKGRGHVNITISGGTIGNDYEYIIPKTGEGGNTPSTITETDFTKWSAADWITWKNHNHVPNTEYDPSNGRLTHTKGGNVYGGGMGRYYQLDGTTPISAVDWWKVGNVKSTTLNISGDTWIMGNVYGGGELGAVVPYTDNTDADNPVVEGGTTSISITGGTIGTEVTGTTPVKETVPVPDNGNSSVQYTYGSVYGGGMGMEKHDNNDRHGGDVKGNTTVTMSGENTEVRASVYGGGEIAVVHGNTNVTVSGGKIGRDEVKVASDTDPGYVLYGGATMGNVYGGGKGALEHVEAGLVKGNTNVTINAGETAGQPFIYHNVYGGGALGSVGTFTASTGTDDDAHVPAGVPLHWTSGGTATVTINGGTIGISGRDNGMVNGSSRGGIEKPSGTPAIDRYDKVAWVKDAVVIIGEASGTSTGPHIKGSVYGGGENGHNSGDATVTVNRGTIGIVDTSDPWYSFIPSGKTQEDDDYAAYEAIDKKALITRGNVYGAGCGTDTYTGDDNKEYHNPKTGVVCGNTFVNIAGGHIGHSVYGAGSMGAVGTITSEEKHDVTIENGKEVPYGFALSWPYKFEFAPNTGKATVNITGGHIGTNNIDGGDVFGSARGEAGDRYETANLAFVGETEVNVNYSVMPSEEDIPDIKTKYSIPCVTGSVHGSGEDGYVYGDTHVTINNGLVGHSVYGAGKGKGTYKVTLAKIVGGGNYDANIYSLISGKVMGNTYVTMNGGLVGRNVYGGGNMASVGKGNYAGGSDDYSTVGYGELPPSANQTLWSNTDFLNSGKATVNVFGGKVGIITTETKNNLPYGNVFGGSAGEAAPNVPQTLTPRYHYCPAFFSGYVNETNVTIGGGYICTAACKDKVNEDHVVGETMTMEELKAAFTDEVITSSWEAMTVSPTIVASVYGGGQDGHVRRDTKVTVNSGVIGLAYNSDNQGTLGTPDLDDPQWLHRGNIYGAGSGISEYEFDFDNNGSIEGSVTIGDKAYPEKDYSTSAGSVTRFTEVNVLGGTIHRNVYGGGSMGGVGAPKITQGDDQYKKGDSAEGHGEGKQSQCTVNIGGGTGVVTIGTPIDYQAHYGGEVYGASRGLSAESPLGSVVWTKVLVKDGAYIQGNVFGGGDAGMVKKDTDVQIGEKASPSGNGN